MTAAKKAASKKKAATKKTAKAPVDQANNNSSTAPVPPPESDLDVAKTEAKFRFTFEFKVLNSAGKEVEVIKQSVLMKDDIEGLAFNEAIIQVQSLFPKLQLIYTQNFKREVL